MTRPTPSTPTSAERAQAQITAHCQRLTERRAEASLRYLLRRVCSLSQRLDTAEAEQRTNDE
jgi:hypothetical protein